MPQLLSRVLKPSVYKNVLKHNKKMVRWCSSTPIYPYMLIDHVLKVGENDQVTRRSGSDGEIEIIFKNTCLATEVHSAMSTGFNQNGVNIHMKDRKFLRDIDKIRLNIYYKPSDPKSKSVSVHLPPLPQGSQITNLAMSSLPDLENEEWDLSLSSIDIRTYVGLISKPRMLMRLLAHTQEKDKPKYDLMWKKDIPQYMSYELEEMNSFTRIDHLVESPSGEQFLISWYYGDEMVLYKGETTLMHKTKRFMVFKEQEMNKEKKYDKDMIYTENIGDFCIFLGHGEALCVPSTSSPGLKANCIYFVGHNYGVFDITTQNCTLFSMEGGPFRSFEFPYWPHPFSLTPHSH
ncbi:unnamed protein product [Arabis nemorensis]|uniref:KIB1-4 beta-propeller domain-containing protein n=1 Tax=Arabis nemorensis TaxID=586526 RepID=A0A565C3B0_9BRAS|nr:unnamed protein product [Arabis nemorensis]